MDKLALLRLIDDSGVSALVKKAFSKVDRINFVPSGLKAFAYEDRPIPLPEGQTTSQPSLIAFILHRLDLKKGLSVLEVGTGFGFQTALLRDIVGENGFVISIEFSKAIFEQAQLRVRERNVLLVHGDGKKGFKQKAPFDRIVVSAACPSMPDELFAQLAENGRMVYPQESLYGQDLVLVEKTGGKPVVKVLLPVAFVTLK